MRKHLPRGDEKALVRPRAGGSIRLPDMKSAVSFAAGYVLNSRLAGLWFRIARASAAFTYFYHIFLAQLRLLAESGCSLWNDSGQVAFLLYKPESPNCAELLTSF